VGEYARMLEFLCSILHMCGGFEPDKLLQPQVLSLLAACMCLAFAMRR
jgi:hypothetical protein